MIDDTKVADRADQELSMDEILSSIRNIITEDQENKRGHRRTFPEDSTTNPSGARVMEDLPKFDNEDDFVLPNFNEKSEKDVRQDFQKSAFPRSVFPDEDFEMRQQNERSFQEQVKPYYLREQFVREAESTEDRISKALKGIVESYGQRSTYNKDDVSMYEQVQGSSKLTDVINTMIEKIVVVRIEEWLHTNLSRILEKAILRELEQIVSKMKF
ncbi:MAG: hypothetical protein H6492_00405 [Candidatus Paracaedibacteraceae bacterium]|nr:hypothetical protein [Candidatus Paracaedibacteraceae bacterium]